MQALWKKGISNMVEEVGEIFNFIYLMPIFHSPLFMFSILGFL